MRVFRALAILIAVLQVPSFAQSNPSRRLVITGTVVSVKPKFIDTRDDKQNTFVVSLLLQFRNKSDRPIIILRPARFPGVKKLSFFRDISAHEEIEGARLSWSEMYELDFDPIPYFIKSLETAAEPWTDFPVIAPEAYYECVDSFVVKTGYSYPKDRDTMRPKIDLLSIRSQYQALKVSYHLSLSNRNEGSALEDARHRWREFGELMLDPNGDYEVTSELIINRPSD